MARPEAIDVDPEEAIRHFLAKTTRATGSWGEMAAAEHVRAFTVAQSAKFKILEVLRREVQNAIERGETFASFADKVEPFLVREGWWGRHVIDGKMVELGSARRLRIIFDTNLRMTHARGRWERIHRLADRLPYLRYVAVMDDRTRDNHRRFHGTVLPVEHEFWKTHYPPNGWGCRCIVQQLGKDDLERFGYEVTDPPGDLRGVPTEFAHNAGTVDLNARQDRLLREARRRLEGKLPHEIEYPETRLERWTAELDRLLVRDPDAADAAILEGLRSEDFERHLTGFQAGDWPVAILGKEVARALGAKSRVVRLSQYTATKQAYRHSRLKPIDYENIQSLLDNGRIFDDLRPNVAVLCSRDGEYPAWRAVVKATAEDGANGEKLEVFLTTQHRAHARHLARIERNQKRIR